MSEMLVLAALVCVAVGVVKEEIFWRWWEASGPQLMLLGLVLLALAGLLRTR